MDAEKILIFITLAGVGTAYISWLSYTAWGRAFNALPEWQPVLTAIGLLPLVVAVGIAYDWSTALDVLVMLAALGAASLVRGLVRLAKQVAKDNDARNSAVAYAKQIAGRD